MTERDNDASRGPVETIRDGALKLPIFRNQGERGDRYSVVPARIYTDEKSGEIRETSSLSGAEILRMSNLLQRGYDRISEFKSQAREAERNADDGERGQPRTRQRGHRSTRARGEERER